MVSSINGQDRFVGYGGIFLEPRQGALQHVDIHEGGGAKTAALDEDGFLAQSVGGLQHFAIGAEHGRAAQTELDELESHDAVVDVAKFDPAEFEHVDLDSADGEFVEKRLD